jgi:predicted amidohydrolase
MAEASPLRIAALQLNGRDDVASGVRADGEAVDHERTSVARALAWTRAALDRGARLVVLPENWAGLAPAGVRPPWATRADDPEGGAVLLPFLRLAADYDATIVLGGNPEWDAAGRRFNVLHVLGARGILARYRKIHRFDADLPDGTSLRESAHTSAGEALVLVQLPRLSLGLSICYDLRFPELYRALAAAGADALVIPSAFTQPTGAAHWEVLLRARAIENQAWVIAPAQTGTHGHGRASWGHTMVVDPWGTVVAQASEGEGCVLHDLDPAVRDWAHARLPVRSHRALPATPPLVVIDAR